MKDYLRLMGVILLAGLAGCGKSEPKPAAKIDLNSNSSGNPVTAPVDYLGAVAKAKKTAVKVLDTASLKQTIMLFHEQEDRYPNDLNELVAKHYVPSLPAPPYQMKFSYNPKTGEVKVVPQ